MLSFIEILKAILFGIVEGITIFFDRDSVRQRRTEHTGAHRLRPYGFPDAQGKAEPGIKKAGISANKRGTIRWTYQGNMV